MSARNVNTVDDLLPPRADESSSRAQEERLVAPAKKKMRRCSVGKYSLRTLIGVQVVFALFFGWVGARLYSFRQQEAAVTSVARRHFSFDSNPASPRWFWSNVEKITGVQTNDYVTGTNSDAPLTLTEAKQIRRLRYLNCLYVERGVSEPAVIDELAHLPNLRWLELRDDPERKSYLDDEDLLPLAQNRSVTRLIIFSEHVTDKGIAALADMPNVEILDIAYGRVSIGGLRPWIARNRLRELSIPCRLTREDCEELSKFTSLESLSMYELKPVCAEFIAMLPKLRRIKISGPFVDPDIFGDNSILPGQIEIWHRSLQLSMPTSIPPSSKE